MEAYRVSCRELPPQGPPPIDAIMTRAESKADQSRAELEVEMEVEGPKNRFDCQLSVGPYSLNYYCLETRITIRTNLIMNN